MSNHPLSRLTADGAWAVVPCIVLLLMPARLDASEEYALQESEPSSRPFRVHGSLDARGKLQAAVGGDKAVALNLKVDAEFEYLERRQPEIGRDAQALRSVRHYKQAKATISVDEQKTFVRLRDGRKLIAAQGQQEGVQVHSPNGPMTREELDLLRFPADSLAVLALLPTTSVEVGDTWSPESWAHQMLVGVEAVLESELSCELKSVEDDTARVGFEGKVEGAVGGAATTIEISGHYLFDLKKHYLKHLELKQVEEGSVSAVRPGLDVTAQVVLTRVPASAAGPLDDTALAKVSAEPSPEELLLTFQSPANIRFRYDRNWHVFHKQVAVLRLLERGSLIAQCNVVPIKSLPAGQHTSDEEFLTDVQRQLGENLDKIAETKTLSTGDGRFVHRVTAIGEANGTPMHWIYYLCASPSGRQVSFVFAVETQLLERLNGRDLKIVKSVEFLSGRSPRSVQGR